MRSQTSVGTIRDALCVGGEERRRVVEAHVEAEEAHGFGRQSEEGSIIVTHDRTDLGCTNAQHRKCYWLGSRMRNGTT
jgi:hypothetical protein